MDLENQKRVKDFADQYGPENVVVLLGAAEGEGAVDEAEGTEPAAAVEPEPAAEPKPEPAEPTTADLYARRPRKRKAVVDQLARELEVEDDAEAAAADAPKGGDE